MKDATPETIHALEAALRAVTDTPNAEIAEVAGHLLSDLQSGAARFYAVSSEPAEVSDVVGFADKRWDGAATVRLPLIHSCPSCHGLRYIERDGQLTDDPHLATRLALVAAGYRLRQNETRAAGGGFARMNGHDGHADDWQWLPDPMPCVCGAESLIEREEAAA